MFRTLLTTTAMFAVLQTGAIAADTTTGEAMKPAPFFQEGGKYERRVDEQGYFETGPGQVLANTLIGMSVHTGASDEAEAIGDINDIILSSNGDAEAVIIGVGGFLGLGEKDVAVDFDRIGWVEREGERRIVVDATREELESAPSYDRVAMNDTVSRTMTSARKQADEMQENASEMVENTMDSLSMGGAVDRESLEAAELSVIEPADLEGAIVYGANDESVGEVSEVTTDDAGRVASMTVDVGGFLGINEKKVPLSVEKADIRKTQDGELVVFTEFTRSQLERQAARTDERRRLNTAG